jgi:hypothetical protein
MARRRVRAHRRRRRPPLSRAGPWVPRAAGGTGPRRRPLRTVPFRSGRPCRGPGNRAPPDAARPGPGAQRSRRPRTPGPSPDTRLRCRRSRAPARRRAPGPSADTRLRCRRSRAPARRRAPGPWAASARTSPAPARRSRWMIHPATGRAPGRSRPWIPARAGCPPAGPPLTGRLRTGRLRTGRLWTGRLWTGRLWTGRLRAGLPRAGRLWTGRLRAGRLRTGGLRTGLPRRRILTAGAGNGVRPVRARRSRRLTGTLARRSPTRDSRPGGRRGQPVRCGQAAGPGGAGRAE